MWRTRLLGRQPVLTPAPTAQVDANAGTWPRRTPTSRPLGAARRARAYSLRDACLTHATGAPELHASGWLRRAMPQHAGIHGVDSEVRDLALPRACACTRAQRTHVARPSGAGRARGVVALPRVHAWDARQGVRAETEGQARRRAPGVTPREVTVLKDGPTTRGAGCAARRIYAPRCKSWRTRRGWTMRCRGRVLCRHKLGARRRLCKLRSAARPRARAPARVRRATRSAHHLRCAGALLRREPRVPLSTGCHKRAHIRPCARAEGAAATKRTGHIDYSACNKRVRGGAAALHARAASPRTRCHRRRH